MDLGLRKAFRLWSETSRVDFRTEAFNDEPGELSGSEQQHQLGVVRVDHFDLPGPADPVRPEAGVLAARPAGAV